MSSSKIEWTGRSDWNPLRGCTRKSEACRNCYAEIMAARFSLPGQWGHGFAHIIGGDHRWTGKVEVQWDRLTLPLSWRTPSLIFGSSTSDLFHESLTVEEIASIYAVSVAAHHLRGHVTQWLTKRPDRMHELLNSAEFWEIVNAYASGHVMERVDPLDRRSDDARATCDDYGPGAPPPGVWLGTSVENQATADERVPHLLATPAAVRFVSCEPLLGPVDLRSIKAPRYPDEPEDSLAIDWRFDALTTGDYYWFDCEDGQPGDAGDGPYREHRIDWVIAGGESGTGARPMHPGWARDLRDQCTGATLHGDDAPVPFFFKQWGEWAPRSTGGDVTECGGSGTPDCAWPDGSIASGTAVEHGGAGQFLSCVGKKAAGRLLDGIEHNGMPGARS